MKQIEFHPDAAEEARQAARYYQGIRAGLGDDFQMELDKALAYIRNNPLLYGVVPAPSEFALSTDSPT